MGKGVLRQTRNFSAGILTDFKKHGPGLAAFSGYEYWFFY